MQPLAVRLPIAPSATSQSLTGLLLFLGLTLVVSPVLGQEAEPSVKQAQDQDAEVPSVPESVEIDPSADDRDIAERLTRILTATERFDDPQVRVEEGIVFLSGRTTQEDFRTWAGDLARKTQDVVAVVNRIEVVEGSIWDLSPAWAEIRTLTREAIQASPLIGLAAVLLLATWFASKLAVQIAERVFEKRMSNRLLRQVATRAVAIPVFLLGLYLVLRISGLTQMAATVVGGTGLIGLVIGIAFRDIAENFLASILISTQRPFAIGDLIEVEGQRGFVQSVTTRGTLLMTLDGNHVQIPNSTVYKAVIHNFTANPSTRLHFVVGIGYDDSVTQAQKVALNVLREHPVVLEDPEPLVLVDDLGASTVNLHVYFWINIHEHSNLKARSSVVRLVKRAFENANISMPDEAREVVFPKGVPVISQEKNGDRQLRSPPPSTESPTHADEDEVANAAEGGLSSEAAEIHQQAEQSRRPDEGENLLEEAPRQPTGSVH